MVYRSGCWKKFVKKVSSLEESITLESTLFLPLSSQIKQSKSLITYTLTIWPLAVNKLAYLSLVLFSGNGIVLGLATTLQC